MPSPEHSVRIRDGDREVEVCGNPAFVRQVLDDLPTLLTRLQGTAPGRTAISMPAPPAQPLDAPGNGEAAHTALAEVIPPHPALTEPLPSPAAPVGRRRPARATGGRRVVAASVGAPDLERQVFEVLRGSSRPLAVSAIRERLEGQPTGQEVRRLLERAGDRVTRSEERPATYSLR